MRGGVAMCVYADQFMRLKSLLFAACAFCLCSVHPNKLAAEDPIRFNQLGYYPQSVKRFITANSNAATFSIKDGSGQVVLSGSLVAKGTWPLSGENVKVGDFSALTETGTYTINLSDNSISAPFSISADLYGQALCTSLKGFYYQRASMALDQRYAGQWARPEGHSDTDCRFHSSSGHSSGSLSSTKGWYDAGDYNKYVINAGISVGTLLALYELFPSVVPDRATDIPESGNALSDLLDEVRYELDWLLTMQDADGGVFFKITSLDFCGFVMPQDDPLPRYVVGKSTTSTLDFAAMTAQAARIWEKSDAPFAATCLSAAEKAWAWAKTHNNIIYTNPADVKTGEYGDGVFKDEFFWAAAELYATTAKAEYLDYVNNNRGGNPMGLTAYWGGMQNLGYFTLAINSTTPDNLASALRSAITTAADSLVNRIQAIPYRIPDVSFVWGSNSVYMNAAITLAYAFQVTKQAKYLDAIVETADYIFGKNAVGYCFVTGMGSRQVMNPHHRPSYADDVEAPVPGLLSGGPNRGKQDQLDYPYSEPARCYLDEMPSYASNEIAINWNAPLVFVLGFLQANKLELGGSAVRQPGSLQHTEKAPPGIQACYLPATQAVTLSLSRLTPGPLAVRISDIRGRSIAQWTTQQAEALNRQITLDARTLPVGLHMITLERAGVYHAVCSVLVTR